MKQEKSVLILVENLSVPYDSRVWKEAQALTQAGYRVSVISPMGVGYDEAPYEVREGVHIWRYRVREAAGGVLDYGREYAVSLVQMTRLAWRVFRERGFQAIQLCNPPDLLFLVALPYRWMGRRVIFDHHDLSPEAYQSKTGKTGGSVLRLLHLFERLTFRLAHVVLSTNESYRHLALGRGGKREDEVFVVRNGPDPERWKPGEPELSLKQGKPHLLVYLGTIGEQDGVDYALRAAAHLKAQGREDWHLLIIGDGTALPALRRLAETLGLREQVSFAGRWTDRERVRRALSTADVCLCPDPKTPLNDLSTMIKTLEYMAMERAIVAFHLRETQASAGDAALYARPNDEAEFARHIATLLDDPELRRTMGQRGRQRIEQGLSWNHSREQLLAAYRSALEAEPVGAPSLVLPDA